MASTGRGILLKVEAGSWKMKVIAGGEIGLLKEF